MANIKQGIGCFIHPSVIIEDGAEIELGDHVFIGDNVHILPGKLKIGDYSKIHSGTYINPQKYVTLGHLAWIGQNCVIDGTGGITAGNYLGVGMGSQLYSHIRHGDILQGCRFEQNKELNIGDDVWFVGQCLVSPIIAENKSMAMLGSVITKDMTYNAIYGGNPAKIISDKIGLAYMDFTLREKISRLQSFIDEYEKETLLKLPVEIVNTHLPIVYNPEITYYNIFNRTYTKRNTPIEASFNKWLFRYKAKFIPA